MCFVYVNAKKTQRGEGGLGSHHKTQYFILSTCLVYEGSCLLKLELEEGSQSARLHCRMTNLSTTHWEQLEAVFFLSCQTQLTLKACGFTDADGKKKIRQMCNNILCKCLICDF